MSLQCARIVVRRSDGGFHFNDWRFVVRMIVGLSRHCICERFPDEENHAQQADHDQRAENRDDNDDHSVVTVGVRFEFVCIG